MTSPRSRAARREGEELRVPLLWLVAAALFFVAGATAAYLAPPEVMLLFAFLSASSLIRWSYLTDPYYRDVLFPVVGGIFFFLVGYVVYSGGSRRMGLSFAFIGLVMVVVATWSFMRPRRPRRVVTKKESWR